MHVIRDLVFLALLTPGLALPTSGTSKDDSLKMSVAQSISEPPAGWTKDESTKVDKDTAMMTLRIYLKQQDMDKFHDLAMKVR